LAVILQLKQLGGFMFVFILFALLPNAQAQNVPRAQNYVNQHLSELSTRQEFQQRQMEVERAHLEEQNQFHNGNIVSEPQNPYGVVHDSFDEALPDFDKPVKTYQANPLEQVRVDAGQQRDDLAYQERLHKGYVNQYLRNAKQDGAQVYINEDKIVFEAGKQKSAPSRSNASSR
jgi:hypothetical protein